MSLLRNLERIYPRLTDKELSILSRVLHNAMCDDARAYYDTPLDRTAMIGYAAVILRDLDFLEVYPVLLRVEALLNETPPPSEVVLASRAVADIYASTVAFELVRYHATDKGELH